MIWMTSFTTTCMSYCKLLFCLQDLKFQLLGICFVSCSCDCGSVCWLLLSSLVCAFLQAYVVFTKYCRKEQPLTIVQGGTKYVAAPSSTQLATCTTATTTTTTTNMWWHDDDDDDDDRYSTFSYSLFQAYVVLKYSEKEQPPTTIRGGSKYVAAPKSSTHMSTLNSSNANSMGEKLYDDPDPGSGNSMEKDIQVGMMMRMS